ncbi:hypothetical protein [Fimbriiglobus ruber]|uniref:Uncharacterized protein n=1 Tax=Fimbriiglobus ruber TaxID=1908690 RepID=A0A225DPQ6_9BACT|nr:hypothetical protein [Fimbriiglobus ruber]OWK39199.1 hypothetical protein FRUB_06281 [Fimbriiglobus ruber]
MVDREIYPAIADRAAEEGATIDWCDEVGVAADECPARGGTLRKATPRFWTSPTAISG